MGPDSEFDGWRKRRERGDRHEVGGEGDVAHSVQPRCGERERRAHQMTGDEQQFVDVMAEFYDELLYELRDRARGPVVMGPTLGPDSEFAEWIRERDSDE